MVGLKGMVLGNELEKEMAELGCSLITLGSLKLLEKRLGVGFQCLSFGIDLSSLIKFKGSFNTLKYRIYYKTAYKLGK